MALVATVQLMQAMTFRANTASGHEVILDASPDVGGSGAGATPMELLMASLGGCTGMDVISVLRKMRQDVTGYEVRVSGDRAPEHPKIFTSIQVEHVVRGRKLSEQMVKRAVELSATRYCPAAAMLGRAARIEDLYRIIDEDSGQERVGILNP
ncbi:MAG: OsmC family protein [Chloroflexi bacterium]|nr:OsmC family protein [Chloroflexota bacterium]